MLSAQDIKKLTDYQIVVFKDVFATKEELDEKFGVIEKKLSRLQTSVDSFAKDSLSKEQELPTINRRIKDVENWVDKAAPKLGIKFNH